MASTTMKRPQKFVSDIQPVRSTRRRRRRMPVKGLGTDIYWFRMSRGWSPERLGRAWGLSGMTLRKIEAGECDLERLSPETKRALAAGLDRDFREMWS